MLKELTKGSLILLTLELLGTALAFPFQNISVGATLIEGHIQGNVTWTLADSPYVITDDVVIDDGSMLTIDPGVEVRFKGNFTLTVNGSLYAEGTVDSLITFTSNKPDPTAGDWNKIEFTGGPDESFIMKHSAIKYATQGLVVESAGKAIMENSQVTAISRNGIGVAGECNFLVRDCIIEVESNGISAYGEVSSGITVVNNHIVSNNGYGVHVIGQPPHCSNSKHNNFRQHDSLQEGWNTSCCRCWGTVREQRQDQLGRNTEQYTSMRREWRIPLRI